MSSKPLRAATLFIFALLCLPRSGANAGAPSLRALAERRGFFVGGAMRLYDEIFADHQYFETFAREFNMVVPEHVMKFGDTHPEPGRYDFRKADYLVHFAEKNKMKVRGHTLIWHDANPKWVDSIKEPSGLLSTMKDHISTVASHFAGHVYSWDVVNEAFDENGRIQNMGPWPKADTGRQKGDYIRDAFRWAHDADRGARLFYNDFGAEEINAKSDGIYKFIRQLIAENVPIDGIGFQMHVSANEKISEDSLRRNFERFSELGLRIHVTEMDVGIPSKTPDAKWLNRQAMVYAMVMRACLATTRCEAFLTWGLTDKYTWIEETSKLKAPLLFDRQYNPKPAYFSLEQLLFSPGE